MRWSMLYIASFLVFITACGQGERLPTKGEDMDTDVLDRDWLFTVDTMQKDSELTVKIVVTNLRDKRASIQFASGQLYEIILTNEKQADVYRYSEGRMFTMAITELSFAPHESKTYEEVIPLDMISVGTYTLKTKLVPMAIDKKEWSNEEIFQSSITMEITN